VNREKMVFNCFTCGVGGSIPTLIMHLKGITYPEAIEHLISFVSGEVPDDFEARMRLILEWDEEVADIEFPRFSRRVLKPWQNYPIAAFDKRNVSEETQRAFGLGYDPEHYRRLKSGEEYVGRAIIIPHFFEGNLVGYQSGWLDEDRPKKVPKYTNTRNFPKSETLFNFDAARESADSVFVVESAITAMFITSLGFSAVGTFGAEVSENQLDLLSNFDSIIMAGDNDSSGHKMNRHVSRRLRDTIDVQVMPHLAMAKGDLNDLEPGFAYHMCKTDHIPAWQYLAWMAEGVV